MTDLHFHCLPFIDDGPRSWDQAVDLCRAAADEGTKTIVATPHVLRDPWINADVSARDAAILRLNDLVGGTPAILAGCEVYFTPDLPELLEDGVDGPLTTLNRGDHLLVEFPLLSVPREADLVIHELTLMGFVTVIAHPERNLEFAANPARLASLVAKGAKTQVTAGSLIGEFGPNAFDTVLAFRKLGLVHLIASDAHSVDRRPPCLREARDWVRNAWGEDAERALCIDGPDQIVQGAAAIPSSEETGAE